jgi:membrane protein DedA with SNARE-associated domain
MSKNEYECTAMISPAYDFFLHFSGPTSYLLIFCLLMACGMGVPVPEDIVLFAAALLAYYQNANVHMMVIVSLVGVLLGDSIVFLLGHTFGERIRKRKPFSTILPDERFNALKEKFAEDGNKVIFAGRFMPGLRAPIFFTAGSLHLRYRTFAFYDGLAALISVPTIIYTVWWFGDELEEVIQTIKRVQFGIVGVILVVIAILIIRYLIKRRQKNFLKS